MFKTTVTSQNRVSVPFLPLAVFLNLTFLLLYWARKETFPHKVPHKCLFKYLVALKWLKKTEEV